MPSATHYRLPKVRLLHLLEELHASSIEAASLCLPPNLSRTGVDDIIAAALDVTTVPVDLPDAIVGSPTGAIIFWGPRHRYLIMPPFPVREQRISNACEIEPLYSLLHQDFLIALVIVRLGEYGIGVYRGERLLSSKVGTGLVHARHRQGGSSSHRFERHREKQMETFFTRVCTHVREVLEPHLGDVDYLVYGGTRETTADFRKQCHFLRQFDARTIDLLLGTRDPNQRGLAEAIEEAWSSRVIQW